MSLVLASAVRGVAESPMGTAITWVSTAAGAACVTSSSVTTLRVILTCCPFVPTQSHDEMIRLFLFLSWSMWSRWCLATWPFVNSTSKDTGPDILTTWPMKTSWPGPKLSITCSLASKDLLRAWLSCTTFWRCCCASTLLIHRVVLGQT